MRADDAVDWTGAHHAPARRAPRIASLVPSLTELLFALELGGHVVARTGFCVHPKPAVRGVPKIGGTKDPDLARLRVIAPTHLIVNVDENRREVVDEARTFVPHIVVTDPREPDDNLRLTGCSARCSIASARPRHCARDMSQRAMPRVQRRACWRACGCCTSSGSARG